MLLAGTASGLSRVPICRMSDLLTAGAQSDGAVGATGAARARPGRGGSSVQTHRLQDLKLDMLKEFQELVWAPDP